MKKIISLFQRNYDGDRLVRDEIVPGAEWVIAGEGVATRKFDGTACLMRAGALYKRYDAKRGRTPPQGFLPAQLEPDAVTGHWPGWIAVDRTAPGDRWHVEALAHTTVLYGLLPDGTYELCGPQVQGNPERRARHVLIAHGFEVLDEAPFPDDGFHVYRGQGSAPRDFVGLRAYLAMADIEGIVWWRDLADSDCDKVKIKTKDFGLKRLAPDADSVR